MSRRRDAQLVGAEVALAAAREELSRLDNLAYHKRRDLAAIDGSPTIVRASEPACAHEAATEAALAVIEKQRDVAMRQVLHYEAVVHGYDVDVIPADDLNAAAARRNARVHALVKKAPTPVERTTKWLQFAELFVSPRVAREEIGDLLEIIHRYERYRRPPWHIYVRAITGAILAVWHTWGDKLAALKRIGG